MHRIVGMSHVPELEAIVRQVGDYDPTDAKGVTPFDDPAMMIKFAAVKANEPMLVITGSFPTHGCGDIDMIAAKLKKANPAAVIVQFTAVPGTGPCIDGTIPKAGNSATKNAHLVARLLVAEEDDLTSERRKAIFPAVVWKKQ